MTSSLPSGLVAPRRSKRSAWLVLLALGCAARSEPTSAPAAPQPAPESMTESGQPGYGQPPSSLVPQAQQAPAGTAAPGDESVHFNTVEEAEAALARAHEELSTLYARRDAVQEGEAAKKPSAAPKRSAPAAAEEAEADSQSRQRCDLACRAFASLGRAAGAVCRLAGDDSERCTRAKKLVDDGARRVQGCAC
jgi:hypothetical protein